MTIKISKPKFNIREKLSELDKPSGLKGNELMRSDTTQDARDLVSAGRKNMIINGAMTINQRNDTSSYTIPHGTGGSYGGPDRWAVNESTDGSISVNMDGDPAGGNGAGTDVQEFTKAFQLACTGTATLSSGHNTHFFQNIEGYNIANLGWGTMSAKPVTLSFWVKTNKAGIYAVGLENNAPDRCCIRDYYQSGNFKWNKVVLTFPGCTDGTWLQTDGCGMRVRFCLASGVQYDNGVDGEWVNSDNLCTTKSQVVNFMDSTNNRFMITGVQLEVGENATEFEHRSHSEELSLCQRYFAIFPGRSGGIPFWQCYMGSSSGYCSIPVPNFNFRIVPTPTDKTTGTSSSSGNMYDVGGANIKSNFTGNGTVTLSCGGYAPSGIGLIMNFGTHNSGDKDGVVASWNGATPGIFLDAEL